MISIVIPIYNEEANIDKLTESILAALSYVKYEVLFINDGSTDNCSDNLTLEVRKVLNDACGDVRPLFCPICPSYPLSPLCACPWGRGNPVHP